MSLRKNLLYDENEELDVSFLEDEENIVNSFSENIKNEIIRIPKITDQIYSELACSDDNFIFKIAYELIKRSKKFRNIFEKDEIKIYLDFIESINKDEYLLSLAYEAMIFSQENNEIKLLTRIGFNIDNSKLIENITSKLYDYKRRDKSFADLGFNFKDKNILKGDIVTLFQENTIYQLLEEIKENEGNEVLLKEILIKHNTNEKSNVVKKLEEMLNNSNELNDNIDFLKKSHEKLKNLASIMKVKKLEIEINPIKKIKEQLKEIKDTDIQKKSLELGLDYAFFYFIDILSIFEIKVTNLIEESHDGLRENQRKRKIVFALWYYDYCKKTNESLYIDDIINHMGINYKKIIEDSFYKQTLKIIQNIYENIIYKEAKELDAKLQKIKKENKQSDIRNIDRASFEKKLMSKFNNDTLIVELAEKHSNNGLEDMIGRELMFLLKHRKKEEEKKVVRKLLNTIYKYNKEIIECPLEYLAKNRKNQKNIEDMKCSYNEISTLFKSLIRKQKNKIYKYDNDYLDKLHEIVKIDFKIEFHCPEKLMKELKELINDFFLITQDDLDEVNKIIKNLPLKRVKES